jgi:hypothetical protein
MIDQIYLREHVKQKVIGISAVDELRYRGLLALFLSVGQVTTGP